MVIGDGDDRPRLAEQAIRLGLRGVQFTGPVTDDEMHSYLASTEVFVLPSEKEGFGIAFLEALAHGRPVIGGNVGGTPEVVVDGETGILIDPDNLGEVVDAMGRLLGDSALQDRMGAAARQRVSSEYSYEMFAGRVEALLSSLLREHGSRDRAF